ncbi:MAG: hypothetical protein HYY97_15905 [Rhodocyclales bacterium]|nr:hypothetical protein [Rhodocyclales bacterium]
MTWTIDLDAATATNDSGIVIKFAPVPGEPGAFDGIPVGLPDALRKAAPTALARLMREAGEAYIAARAARH